ncbi:MAG: chromate efflux transporter [Actinobacteria bacterium]|nr:chromate efflux transporter [Actinomycetota bacterium]
MNPRRSSTTDDEALAPEEPTRVSFRDALRFWTKLGFINFGGPAGQIALMHDELVERRRWVSNGRYLHALNYCILLPGPEAQQLAIYIGWLLNGTLGGIAAGVLFVLPAFFLILALSWTFVTHGDVAWVAAVFYGLGAAVIAIVASAVIRVGSKALTNRTLLAIAVAAFVGIFIFTIPFPLIVLGAGGIGYLGARRSPGTFATPDAHAGDGGSAVGDASLERARPSPARTLRVLITGLAVWWVPLLAVALWRGGDDVLTQESIFFSQAALVTFGGAYAVLAYINQAAVQQFGWLEPGQMVTGLGLAESTPGPLIMVTEFVGFLGAYRFPGGLDPVVAGVLGAVVATWATFAPCFLWIFLGAPFIESLRGHSRLNGALSAITAAVVGVILNLAVTFALATLFSTVAQRSLGGVTLPVPDLATLDVFAAGLAAIAFVGLWRYRWKVVLVVAGSALAGLIYKTLL